MASRSASATGSRMPGVVDQRTIGDHPGDRAAVGLDLEHVRRERPHPRTSPRRHGGRRTTRSPGPTSTPLRRGRPPPAPRAHAAGPGRCARGPPAAGPPREPGSAGGAASPTKCTASTTSRPAGSNRAAVVGRRSAAKCPRRRPPSHPPPPAARPMSSALRPAARGPAAAEGQRHRDEHEGDGDQMRGGEPRLQRLGSAPGVGGHGERVLAHRHQSEGRWVETRVRTCAGSEHRAGPAPSTSRRSDRPRARRRAGSPRRPSRRPAPRVRARLPIATHSPRSLGQAERQRGRGQCRQRRRARPGRWPGRRDQARYAAAPGRTQLRSAAAPSRSSGLEVRRGGAQQGSTRDARDHRCDRECHHDRARTRVPVTLTSHMMAQRAARAPREKTDARPGITTTVSRTFATMGPWRRTDGDSLGCPGAALARVAGCARPVDGPSLVLTLATPGHATGAERPRDPHFVHEVDAVRPGRSASMPVWDITARGRRRLGPGRRAGRSPTAPTTSGWSPAGPGTSSASAPCGRSTRRSSSPATPPCGRCSPPMFATTCWRACPPPVSSVSISGRASMRRLFGYRRALLRPPTSPARRSGARHRRRSARYLEAMGATVVQTERTSRRTSSEGWSPPSSLRAYSVVATGNVVLFPKVETLVAHEELRARLQPGSVAGPRRCGRRRPSRASPSRFPDDEESAREPSARQGGEIVAASPGDVAAFEDAGRAGQRTSWSRTRTRRG